MANVKQRLWRSRLLVVLVLAVALLVLALSFTLPTIYLINDLLNLLDLPQIQVPTILRIVQEHALWASMTVLALALVVPDIITLVLEWLDHPHALVEQERQRVEGLKAQCGRIFDRVSSSHIGPPVTAINRDIDDLMKVMGEFKPWPALYNSAMTFLICAMCIDMKTRGAPSAFTEMFRNVIFSPDLLSKAYNDVVGVADDLMTNYGSLRGAWLSVARKARIQWKKSKAL